ncbi:hypothetical protein ASE67_02445 [Sphingomonas sp. Leaf23]|uniref:hypothetical protein n=1 Tax=Sphingomonas sp. Leaf23 TaxID=1735689 RepID=UPI0006F69E43|nr:hypothetical protein [Sphingomonas sp. Leaf23]KQM88619.1 hypothetical protein ASE67_02445 [Sphingomonas sp. Leaf23]
MFGLMRVRTHDAEMAKVRAERDQANTDKRTVGAALSEAISERDSLFAMLKTSTVRGERGRMVRWVDTGLGRFWTQTIDPTALPTPPETTA